MKVVIVGAGILGASVAAAAVGRGDEVVVLEADTPGAGTTSTSFGWVNANNKKPSAYFELNRAGVRAHHELQSGRDRWWAANGNLEWAATTEQAEALEARVSRLRDRDYPVEWLTARQAAALEPDIEIPASVQALAFFPDEGHCFPIILLAHYLAEAQAGGARVFSGARVTAIEPTASGVRVEVAHHEIKAIDADVVVCCAGRWTPQVLAHSNIAVPMLTSETDPALTLGWLATTSPVPTVLNRLLTTPTLNVRPAGGGSLLLQALDRDPTSTPEWGDTEVAGLSDEFLSRIGRLIPRAGNANIWNLTLGHRAMPADGLTVSGFGDPDSRIYVLSTHSGVTLAPVLGSMVVGELHGKTAAMLEPFRPSRFHDQPVLKKPAPARQPGEQ